MEGERILAALNGLLGNETAENLLIHGPYGSGKTTMVKWALNKVKEQNRRPVCIYANCWRYNTSMAIYSKIADALGEPISRRGRASDEIFDRIIELMKTSKRPLLLVLDELEALVQYDNARILHNIVRTDDDCPHFRIIGISDNDAVLFKLPQKIREVLSFTRVEVPPYNRDELNSLLKECAELGLRPGSYDPLLLEEIAEMGLATKGSGRFALEILWRIARNSENRGLESISKDELELVRQEFELIDPRLSREELAIAGLLKNGSKTSSEIYPLFWQMIPRTKRQIRNYLRAMEQKGVISIQNVMAGHRSRYSVIRLGVGCK
jgi:Cdc6-like AAA superfamily ATPase